jgi:PAS domain S-box-containing protein
MSEPLRSTAEGLESSKNDPQAVNAELMALNQELKHKIEAQAQATNDIQNLIHSTGIAALFLDRSKRIKFFTPRACEVFNLMAADRGRPLSDIHSGVHDDELSRDVDCVLSHLEPVQREASTRDGRAYLLDLRPYRTLEGYIDGVVISCTDITERKRFEAQLRRNEEHLRLVLASIAEHAIITLDANGDIVDWNVGAEHTFGFSREEAVGQSTAIFFTPEDRARGVHVEEMRVARELGRASDERWHIRKDGSRLFVSGVVSPIGRDPVTGYVKVARDLTERKQQEENLQRAHDLLEARVAERTRELASQLRDRQQAEEQVRRLLSRLIDVQEEERRRIARDLHDDLGQKMTALHLKLAALSRSTAGLGAAEEHARQAQEWVQQLDRDLDFFTWELRPAALYDLGLNQALRDFVSQWTKNYGIATEYEAIGVDSERWRTDIEVNLYRIAQEALNNIHKHARATKVEVVLQKRAGEIVLSIEDNGVGFDPAITVGGDRGMGLIGMRERAALMRGVLQIERADSGGTTIIVRAPAEAPDHPMPRVTSDNP